ncbi:FKBP-type peptidyl-prolyl cis-trans isomerase [Paraflavisolibacter sp. H34]|uniref:FKBP-type peptidyl-prolyl cis-trans isomerase n=1 Tax=Huijunlia imazamoxiresistens TaxID=3127457 RepID=UPI0030164523
MMRKLILAVAVIFSLAGCLKKSDNSVTCTFDPCAVKAPDAEIQQVKTYIDTNGIVATQHCSGLYYTVLSEGSGKTPQTCLGVIARYKGSLTNGTVFEDQSTGEGVEFNLGYVIRGWTIGLPLVKNGGKIRLYIPPSLAYGSTARTDANGNVVIPANSILIFDVEILAVQ